MTTVSTLLANVRRFAYDVYATDQTDDWFDH